MRHHLIEKMNQLRTSGPKKGLSQSKQAYSLGNTPEVWDWTKRGLKDLHEATMYRVRGREGESKAWVHERDLQEGCPSLSGLFNIYHI